MIEGTARSPRAACGRPDESQGIFPVAGVLLVAHGEYSQSTAFYSFCSRTFAADCSGRPELVSMDTTRALELVGR